MKKTRRAHLWIGLIASIFIFLESLTGLLMNEPWLVGQSQVEGTRGNFDPSQFNRGQFRQGAGQTNGTQGTNGFSRNGQASGQNGNGQFQRPNGSSNSSFPTGFRGGEGIGQNSLLSTIRGLHEGRIGNTNIKWLIDLVALAMMFLTGTGIYLSIKILGAERRRKKRQEENLEESYN